MQARREWLQQLFRLELEREARVAAGHLSAFEAACGPAPAAAANAPPSASMPNFKRLVAKFEAERMQVLGLERMEIESLQAAGRCH